MVVGSSFWALCPDFLSRFWRCCGYRPLHIQSQSPPSRSKDWSRISLADTFLWHLWLQLDCFSNDLICPPMLASFWLIHHILYDIRIIMLVWNHTVWQFIMKPSAFLIGTFQPVNGEPAAVTEDLHHTKAVCFRSSGPWGHGAPDYSELRRYYG